LLHRAAGKAGNIMYAMGITQFTHGAQGVRSVAVAQLLLGNIGIPGGGVNAQRGQANVQGACDMGMLYHIVTGYMPNPQQGAHPTLASLQRHHSRRLLGQPAQVHGQHAEGLVARHKPGKAYQYLPKLDGTDHSHIASYKLMGEGEVKGMICWADNPAVSGPTAGTSALPGQTGLAGFRGYL
jgi:formate dehydrogenase major subunit